MADASRTAWVGAADPLLCQAPFAVCLAISLLGCAGGSLLLRGDLAPGAARLAARNGQQAVVKVPRAQTRRAKDFLTAC